MGRGRTTGRWVQALGLPFEMPPDPAANGRALRLSLVVPTWNEEAALPRLLDATLGAGAALDRPDEVVVADGGSTDETAAIARERGCRVIHSECGRGHQLAAGAAGAEGDVLVFLHADARPFPGALARMRDALRDPAIHACAFSQAVEAEGRFYRMVERTADRRARRGWVYGDSGLVIRRSVYDAVGGFKRQPLFEDLDLARRLRAHTEVRLLEGARVAVSARRWKREGALRTTLRNWTLTRLWRAGVAPSLLVRFYPRERAAGARTQAPQTEVGH